MSYQPEFDLASPEEDAASAAGLDLAPWVAPQAAAIRWRHLEARMAEADETTRQKVHKWRTGASTPQGGRHRE